MRRGAGRPRVRAGAIAVAVALALGLAGAARAQAPSSPLPLPPPVETEAELGALARFLVENAGCREMTNACQVCQVTEGRIACTTPGIACVKQEWRCLTRAPDAPARPAK